MTYRYKTRPFPHQRQAFVNTAILAAYGLLWEQGCGKTKPLIDTLSYLYLEGKITGVVIVAPNGVHRNWITDEIPAHMPEEVRGQVKHILWESKKVKNKSFQEQMKTIMVHAGLSIVLVCYEATIRPKAKAFLNKFLRSRACLMILDESHKIKDPDSKVKTTLVALGGHAQYRRIATGTPIERPFDIYSQLRFLDPTFWKKRGFETYTNFKEHFGIFAVREFGGREVPQLVAHKNLDELAEYVKAITWRLTKEDAGLNLPPKLYTRRYAEMTDEQWRVYKELKEKCSTRLSSGDELVAVPAITKMLRLQQITCGYVACEAEQPEQWINPDGKNLRMDMVVDDILLEYTGQAIVFSRFTKDIDELCHRLGKAAVRYDGSVSDDNRALAKRRFQLGDAKYFIMSNAGSTGLTLVGAGLFVHYSNDFRLIDRQQREDRAHRIGQTKSVEYMDILVPGTVEEYITNKLIEKKDIVDLVLQDEERPWLQ